MKKIRNIILAGAILLLALGCTQYRVIPYPGGGITGSNTSTVRTAADLYSAIQNAKDGDKIKAKNVVIPTSYLGLMSITKDITITGDMVVGETATTANLSAELRSEGTGKALFSIKSGAIVDFSSLSINVVDAAASSISAIIDVQDGGITAKSFRVETSDNVTVTGIYIGASIKGENVDISTSVSADIKIDANNEDGPDIAGGITGGETTVTLPYDAGTAEEFDAKLKEYGKVRLTEDIAISSFSYTEAGDYSIYLNEKTLTLNAAGTSYINTDTNVSFYNGNVDLKFTNQASTAAHIAMKDDSTLILDNVAMTATSSAINTTASSCTLEVRNDSSITAEGSFAIATNASNPPFGVNIILTDSKFESYYTAVCVNIDAVLTMTRCEASSNHVAVLVRGGKATFEDCKLSSTGLLDVVNDRTDLGYRFETVWGSGTMVSYATLVVGNTMSTAYKYNTEVELINTTLEMTINHGKNDKAKTLFLGSVGEYTTTFKTDNAVQANNARNDYMGPNCIVEYGGQTYELEEKAIGPAVAPFA